MCSKLNHQLVKIFILGKKSSRTWNGKDCQNCRCLYPSQRHCGAKRCRGSHYFNVLARSFTTMRRLRLRIWHLCNKLYYRQEYIMYRIRKNVPLWKAENGPLHWLIAPLLLIGFRYKWLQTIELSSGSQNQCLLSRSEIVLHSYAQLKTSPCALICMQHGHAVPVSKNTPLVRNSGPE